jgi:hypothetical protein
MKRMFRGSAQGGIIYRFGKLIGLPIRGIRRRYLHT